MGTFTLKEARREIRRLYAFGSTFMSYGIWDTVSERYVQ